MSPLRTMVNKNMYRDDSHIRRIENNLFNNSIDEGKAHLTV